MAKVKSHTRKRKNGASKVKQHSRKGPPGHSLSKTYKSNKFGKQVWADYAEDSRLKPPSSKSSPKGNIKLGKKWRKAKKKKSTSKKGMC